MGDIKQAYEWLPEELKVEIFYEAGDSRQDSIFWRKRSNPIGTEERLLQLCLSRKDIYGLTAIVALMREAEVIQAREMFSSYIKQAQKLISDNLEDIFHTIQGCENRNDFKENLVKALANFEFSNT